MLGGGGGAAIAIVALYKFSPVPEYFYYTDIKT